MSLCKNTSFERGSVVPAPCRKDMDLPLSATSQRAINYPA